VLVIGERHHRGTSAILGLVGSELAARPPCPVLIVPYVDHA
jgi:nucleotide-binding universal stress UspA family protein